MSRSELERRIKRFQSLHSLLISIPLTLALMLPVVGFVISIQPGYDPSRDAWKVLWIYPLMALAMLFGIFGSVSFARRFAPLPCPHCTAHLGQRRKHVFDVVGKGCCWKCGQRVIDEGP
jgi:hypothetical protein